MNRKLLRTFTNLIKLNISHKSLRLNYKKKYSTTKKINFDLKIKNLSLSNYIETLKAEYNKLLTTTNYNKSKRLNELKPIMNVLEKRQQIIDNINNVGDLLKENDLEIRKLAQKESEQFMDQLQIINQELIEILFPIQKLDSCNSIILEVNTGVGGQEAMLFAKELFEMYCNFTEYKGWDWQIADFDTTDLGGLRHASALINGESSFKYFKHEAGVHRVQRIPTTEKSGRLHTSTVSVLALPQPSDIDVKIDSRDLKIETKRASGAGGQHVNTTDSAVRILHIPSGLSVDCQVDRSQGKNKQIALTKLRTLLYQKQLEEQVEEQQDMRKSQVRSNFRNEKIRTYNFSQDRITDHRLQGVNMHNLKMFLHGGDNLEALIRNLESQSQIDELFNIVQNLNNKND